MPSGARARATTARPSSRRTTPSIVPHSSSSRSRTVRDTGQKHIFGPAYGDAKLDDAAAKTAMNQLAVGRLLEEAPSPVRAILKHCGDLPSISHRLVELLRCGYTEADGNSLPGPTSSPTVPRKIVPSAMRSPRVSGKSEAADGSNSARMSPRKLPCSFEQVIVVGERALEMEELYDIVSVQWPGRDSQAAFTKLLRCGMDAPQTLFDALSREPEDTDKFKGSCLLNELLIESGFKGLRPDTVRSLMQDLRSPQGERLDVLRYGDRPMLITAPHNIYLIRDGKPPHMMEEYTTFIAQSMSKQVSGTSLAWSRVQQRRSELNWYRGRRQGLEGHDLGRYLDRANRDPNYLDPKEIMHNSWFRKVDMIVSRFTEETEFNVPTLHIDVHGCKDPPATPTHLTVGLAAMLNQSLAGKGMLPASEIKSFGNFLKKEFEVMLYSLDLRPRCLHQVRVLFNVEAMSGAWPLGERRMTQSQQAIFAGFTHSCQLELSKALRKCLRDEAICAKFADCLTRAWVVARQGWLAKRPLCPHPGLRPSPQLGIRGGA